ncbi:MAG: P-II family nitrogen regulator [Calditrichaeota bacterium]|nr:P-II family nitrogen regulator [Calditrichota bacterium]
MKEIKAYIKTDKVEQVVYALEEAGAPGITVVEVHPVGYGFDANYFSRSPQTMRHFFAITKLEIVAKDEEAHKFVEIIREKAYTGSKGDGLIFVTPVEIAVKIRTGAVGDLG